MADMWKENSVVFDIARRTCHEFGIPWVDPRTGETHEPPIPSTQRVSRWAWRENSATWEIWGRHCWIWMDSRPAYCDRGRWLARVESLDHITLFIDGADGWPRYYFDLDRAKLEIEAWLKFRNQWME